MAKCLHTSQAQRGAPASSWRPRRILTQVVYKYYQILLRADGSKLSRHSLPRNVFQIVPHTIPLHTPTIIHSSVFFPYENIGYKIKYQQELWTAFIPYILAEILKSTLHCIVKYLKSHYFNLKKEDTDMFQMGCYTWDTPLPKCCTVNNSLQEEFFKGM